VGEAIPRYEQALADRQRVRGADQPDTLISRNNLAAAYESAGRLAEAIQLLELALADRERVLSAGHPMSGPSAPTRPPPDLAASANSDRLRPAAVLQPRSATGATVLR
jgi:tetratricopeptide (TPR) repeat protein